MTFTEAVVVILLIAVAFAAGHIFLQSSISTKIDAAIDRVTALLHVHHASVVDKIAAATATVTRPVPIVAADVPSVSWSAQGIGTATPPSKTYAQPDGSTIGISPTGTAIPQPVSLLSRIANGDVDAIREALLTGGSVTGPIAAVYAARLLNTASSYESGVTFVKSLPPDALALVKGAYLNPAGLYASDQAGYDPHRPAQQALYVDAWATIEARLAV